MREVCWRQSSEQLAPTAKATLTSEAPVNGIVQSCAAPTIEAMYRANILISEVGVSAVILSIYRATAHRTCWFK